MSNLETLRNLFSEYNIADNIAGKLLNKIHGDKWKTNQKLGTTITHAQIHKSKCKQSYSIDVTPEYYLKFLGMTPMECEPGEIIYDDYWFCCNCGDIVTASNCLFNWSDSGIKCRCGSTVISQCSY